MARVVLGVEYDGGAYAGWQLQQGAPSVQGVLQQALARIADREVAVACAGRTDAGVHALEQVVHFDCEAARPMQSWLRGGNSQLPADVRILWARPAVADFHARYSAIARFYRYVILNRPARSALLRNQATWCHQPLDVDAMQAAGRHLLGEHDFSSFRAQSCQSLSPNRFMYFVEVWRQGDLLLVDICANAFLHHMVRNIVGVLLEIGMGRRGVDWTLELLAARDRRLAAMTAPADGLHLGGVYYPPRYGIAAHPLFARLPAGAARYG